MLEYDLSLSISQTLMTSPSSPSEFPIIVSDKKAVIKIPERLTVLEAVTFKQTCHQILQQKPVPKEIYLDFNQTKFIDSSGIGALVHNLKAARAQEINLFVENVQPVVMNVFTITGLDTILKINNKIVTASTNIPNPKEKELPETHPSVRSKTKRLIDIIGSLVGLSITAILFIPLIIVIKLDSPGPIFFSQIRCGWMGRRFRIWKFRSMCNDAEKLQSQVANQASGAFFKNENDPRITKVGSFLRRTSLDELPQFWNVLKGEMSLVGTRPPTPEEVEKYEVIEWQRLNVKPGMTGEWQVNGRSKVRKFEDVIKLDLKYQDYWSLKYDLKLILRTILILFHNNSGAF